MPIFVFVAQLQQQPQPLITMRRASSTSSANVVVARIISQESRHDPDRLVKYLLSQASLPLTSSSSSLSPLVNNATPRFQNRTFFLSRCVTVLKPWLTIDHLLPRDYKHSVTATYPSYAKWTMLSSTFGTAASVISIQAMLVAIGISQTSQSIIPMAATLNWIVKDGFGQLGGVLFASVVNTRFDADPKRFRWAADWVLAVAVVLEASTCLFPAAFLPVAAVANIGKNVAWISASATRASIHQSFTKENNLADVTAKAASQTVAASVAGTLLGVVLTPVMNQNPTAQVFSAAVLSCAHVYFSYKGLYAVVLPTLNPQRIDLALGPVFSAQSVCALDWNAVAKPSQVAEKERIFPSLFHKDKLVVGSPVSLFPSQLLEDSLNDVRKYNESHVLCFHEDQVHLLYFSDATPEQVLLGYFHAWLAAHKFSGNVQQARRFMQDTNAHEHLQNALERSGWDCKHLFLEAHRARIILE